MAGSALASDSVEQPPYSPLKLSEVSLTYRSFFPGGADPLLTENGLPNRTLGKELGLTLNSDLFKYGYWHNYVHAATDLDTVNGGGQFRTVGYQFELGIHAAAWADVAYHHHSQHLLDTQLQYGHWPVQDALELKIFFYREHTEHNYIIP